MRLADGDQEERRRGPTVWLTYTWDDNEDNDVDFIANELQSVGLAVKLDRWNLQAGLPLWDQIHKFITEPQESDAWCLYATQDSLSSGSCQREFRYALDRALCIRGAAFPVIALFPSSVDESLIPAAISDRLYVSITDPDWKERIKAAVEGRAPSIPHGQPLPYFLQVHPLHGRADERYAIEVRPRAGVWCPFIATIPLEEKGVVEPRIAHGPKGIVPGTHVIVGLQTGPQGNRYRMLAGNEATPTQSYFIFCRQLPNRMLFGQSDGQQYEWQRLATGANAT